MNVLNVVPMAPTAPPSRPRMTPHVSVLLRETIRSIAPRRGGVYIDATLGAGGHTEAILDIAGTRVIGVDQDERAIHIAKFRLKTFSDRVQFVHGKFSEIEAHVRSLGVEQVDGVIADIGVSSMQLDDAETGMSFRHEGPIDMRMDRSSGETALELIERLSDDELADVIYRYGEEKRSRRVARCIKQALIQGELHTTLDLRRAIIRAVGPARIGGVDPATRSFQALRVAVNRELDELTALLVACRNIVHPGGVAAIISFHSLEDRIVKREFRENMWQPITKKPMIASDEETAENPRARSAKLRAAWRRDPETTWPGFGPGDFEDG